MALPRTLIDPRLIYLEPAVRDYPRGREVLARLPDTELVEVASHWKIRQLAYPTLTKDWLRVRLLQRRSAQRLANSISIFVKIDHNLHALTGHAETPGCEDL